MPKISEASPECIELRQQAAYWRAQHARAHERATEWKEKARHFEQLIREQQAQIAELTQQNEALKAKVSQLQKQVFGRKSEQRESSTPEEQDFFSSPETSAEVQHKRGQQPGAKGHGRKRRLGLPTEEFHHTIPDEQQRCPKCGKPWVDFPGTEDSDEIHWEVRLVRFIHKRARYLPTCNCSVLPGIITAPAPAKLIPKGMFSTGFWVRLLLEKFLFQRPLYRIRQVLALEGLCVSQGTLTGGLKRIGALLQPLYTRILERSRAADHWHMDETRWMVFEEAKGKVGHRWWLWVIVSRDTCAYLLEPSRSAEVPKNHLGENAQGILNADRYRVYKALGEKILVAFCWSHIRRDFCRIQEGYVKLRGWAEHWVGLINDLFAQNVKRVEMSPNSEAFDREDQALRSAVASMAQTRDSELAQTTLHSAQRKALESLRNHWEGATLFVDHPEIPMDNNEAERRLRNPVIGRKNYYGSGSIWSGMLTAMAFTLFQTYLLNHIDPHKFLLSYFQACARNSGRPPENLDAWLPWNLTENQKATWGYPRYPP